MRYLEMGKSKKRDVLNDISLYKWLNLINSQFLCNCLIVARPT